MFKGYTAKFDDGFEYTYSQEDEEFEMALQRSTGARVLSPEPSMLRGPIAARLQEQIRVLIDLWDAEPFYFRDVSRRYYNTFEICRNEPPASIEFDDNDLTQYKEWLETLMKSHLSNYNVFTHITCVAASLGLHDLIFVFLLNKAEILFEMSDARGNNVFALAMQSNHKDVVETLLGSGRYQHLTDSHSASMNQSNASNLLDHRVALLLKFLKEHPKLMETADAITAVKIQNLIRSQHYRHDTQNDLHYYQHIMQSMAQRTDSLAIRYAIHQGIPQFLTELLQYNPNAVRYYVPNKNQTNLVEYTIQVLQSGDYRNAERAHRYGRILSILSSYGANLDDRTGAAANVTLSTNAPVVGISFTGPKETNAQNSVSSAEKKIQNLSIDF